MSERRKDRVPDDGGPMLTIEERVRLAEALRRRGPTRPAEMWARSTPAPAGRGVPVEPPHAPRRAVWGIAHPPYGGGRVERCAGCDGCMGTAPSAESEWTMRQPPAPRYHGHAQRAARKRAPVRAPEALAPLDERDARISAALAALAAARSPESA